jgi:hypothetical protein
MSDTNREKKEQQLINQLRDVLSDYLNKYVLMPSMETVGTDIKGQARLAELLFLTNAAVSLVQKEGLEFDKEYLKSLPQEVVRDRIETLNNILEVDGNGELDEKDITNFFSEASSKQFLLPYLKREINWIAISILASSYISSLVLMRALFILLMCIATRDPEKHGMGNGIDEIHFLGAEEKTKLKKLWRRLNGWSHPYGKWTKEVCPIFVSLKPQYHPIHYEMCLRELTEIVDFFLTISISKYEIDSGKVQQLRTEGNVNLLALPMFVSRVS